MKDLWLEMEGRLGSHTMLTAFLALVTRELRRILLSTKGDCHRAHSTHKHQSRKVTANGQLDHMDIMDMKDTDE